MGFWNTGFFGSDDALDGLGQITDEGRAGWKHVRAMLAKAQKGKDPYHDREAQGLMAAALVAASFSGPPKDLPRDAVAWVKEYGKDVTGDDVRAAILLVQHSIDRKDGLRGTWTEEEHEQTFERNLRRLLGSLGAVKAQGGRGRVNNPLARFYNPALTWRR